MTRFTLSWEHYSQQICHGLSALQQNGELVDMTLAADGHYVKVHRFLLSVVSPYIKELLDSANCLHPVIFLNKVSYKTLNSILEYVYTGQAMVSQDQLPELVQAAKELRIKGLEDMSVDMALCSNQIVPNQKETGNVDTRIYVNTTTSEEVPLPNEEESEVGNDTVKSYSHMFGDAANIDSDKDCDTDRYTEMDHSGDETTTQVKQNAKRKQVSQDGKKWKWRPEQRAKFCENTKTLGKDQPVIQYTTTPRGSIQLIINRFMYFLRYTSRKGCGGKGYRQWRCVDYIKGHCPAAVFTKDDVILSRVGVHNHPFHDKRIFKKVQANSVFASIRDAQTEENARNSNT